MAGYTNPWQNWNSGGDYRIQPVDPQQGNIGIYPIGGETGPVRRPQAPPPPTQQPIQSPWPTIRNTPYGGQYGNPGNVDTRSPLSDIAKDYFTLNPSAGFAYYSAGQGGNSHYQRWLQNQFNRYNGNYNAYSGANPGHAAPFTDWMQQNLNPQEEFKRLTPYERGEQPAMFKPSSRRIW